MICNKCNTKYEGNFCPSCGNPSKERSFVLLGFRSNNTFKKLISVLYLGFFLLVMLVVLPEGKTGMLTTADFLIDKISSTILLLFFLSPYFFLSESKLRNSLPLFKQHKAGSSFIGMIIVSFCLFILFGLTSNLHSAEYKADQDNHAYKETSSVAATCETGGYIEYLCEYCGKTSKEDIPALGHNIAEKTHTLATCETAGTTITECVTCGKSETNTIPATGHSLTETSRKEPTTEQDGYIISTCSICSKQVTTEIPKLAPVPDASNSPDATEEASTTKQESKKEAYIASCEPGDYNKIARYPKKYKGNNLYFKGYVMDASESYWGSSITYLIQVTQDDYGFWEDVVYVTYTPNKEDPKILEGDIVTFYGECKGERTYITILGDDPTVPYVAAKYIDLEQQ